ncbi:MAG: 3-hydroxyacyl-CoA dehydrogenase/enoyl-CoA hydratase family protein [Acidobacteriota bacterium]
MSDIRSAAVLGAGTMGAQIAAHLANAGIPTWLLDLTPELARDGLKRARALKPDPFYTADAAGLIRTGGFDADLPRLAEVDLIVESVVERLDVKRALLERVDGVRVGGTIVSSNTSGIPIAALAEGRSADFRRHWLGTHFFNPPRYLHLLEVIPTPDTDPAVVDRISRFADLRLGKGVVVAKDQPNFIANHIGLLGLMEALTLVGSGAYTIEEVDAITGPAIGRPKSATFRTMDIAGLDVLHHVAANLGMPIPPMLHALVERGWVGEKAGQGFYQRQKADPKGPAAGATPADIFVLDPATLTYRPKQPVRIPALDATRGITDIAERTKTLFLDAGKAGIFLRATLGLTLVETARVAPDIAYSSDDVDRAMRWGFGWELGPFEIWDAIGVREVVAALQPAIDAGKTSALPRLVEDVLRSGRNRFREGSVPAAGPGLQILKAAKDRERVVRRNPGASLVDIGDGVLAVEFHTKMNAVGADTLQMLHAGVDEATKNFAALVVGNDAPNFSAGANLMLLLLEAQEGNWDDIDLMIRSFQGATSALRYADVPVVAAPAGLALGGGCEIALHADRVQAAAESYIGLVEAGVGLIPGAGGTKEMLARAVESAAPPYLDLLPRIQPVFETIGFAKVSTSAADARRLGFLRATDRVTMNRDRVMADAKALALVRVGEGYRPPARRTAIPVGGEGLLAALNLGIHLAWRGGRISDHDAHIGRALARILSGGALPNATLVSEQYLLDLEREAFLQLCGEPKTLERIQHTLKTGRTLRN